MLQEEHSKCKKWTILQTAPNHFDTCFNESAMWSLMFSYRWFLFSVKNSSCDLLRHHHSAFGPTGINSAVWLPAAQFEQAVCSECSASYVGAISKTHSNTTVLRVARRKTYQPFKWGNKMTKCLDDNRIWGKFMNDIAVSHVMLQVEIKRCIFYFTKAALELSDTVF